MRMFLTALLAVLAGALGMWGLRMTYRYFSSVPWESLVQAPETRKPMAPMSLPGRPAHPRLDYFGGDGMLRPPQGPYEAAAAPGAAAAPRAAVRSGAPDRTAAVQRGGRQAVRAAAPGKTVTARGTAARGRRPARSLLQMLQSSPGGAGAAAAPGGGGFDSVAGGPASPDEEPDQEASGEREEPAAAPSSARMAPQRTRRSIGAAGSRVIPEAPAPETQEEAD